MPFHPMALHPLGFPTSWQMGSECSVLHVDDDYEPHLKRARDISAHIPLGRTQSHCRTRLGNVVTFPQRRGNFCDCPQSLPSLKCFQTFVLPFYHLLNILLIPLTQDTGDRVCSSLYSVAVLQLAYWLLGFLLN